MLKILTPKYQAKKNGQKFIIEEDLPEIGWYLYVFDKNGKCIDDHLQNNFNATIDFAQKEFGVTKCSWKPIKGLIFS